MACYLLINRNLVSDVLEIRHFVVLYFKENFELTMQLNICRTYYYTL